MDLESLKPRLLDSEYRVTDVRTLLWKRMVSVSISKLLNLNGGQGRNRTADAGLFRAALYQLSYLAVA